MLLASPVLAVLSLRRAARRGDCSSGIELSSRRSGGREL